MMSLTATQTRRLFWIWFGLLMVPCIGAIALTILAQLLGCDPAADPTPLCESMGRHIRRSLQSNLNTFIRYIYSLGLPLWILIYLAYRSFQGRKQVLIGLACIWWVPHAYTILGLITFSRLEHENCQLYGGSCLVFGVEMGDILVAQGNSLWLWILTLPACTLASLIYIFMWIKKRERFAAK